MIREKRRKKKFLNNLLTASLTVLFLAALIYFLIVKVFVVKNVKVEGNILYDEQLIKDTVLNDEYSWNSLYVLLKYTFVDTDEVPFIEMMEVRLTNPQTLTIEVYEKGMLGYLYISAIGENAYFDKNGLVVETSSRIIEDVPMISGIKCDEVVLYEKLPIGQRKLKQMLTLTQTLKRDGLNPDSIQYGGEHAPILKYGDISVQMGSMENLTQKVVRLNEILPKLEGMAGILHLENWTEESVNIIFEKTEPEEESTESEGENTEESTETEDEDGESVSESGGEDENTTPEAGAE